MRVHIRDPHDSDTASTDVECSVGGLGITSHGNVGLSHQHWVQQVMSAGSFDVHNTEGAEAYHKLCMRLTSFRVRHLGSEQTKLSMLRYLCWHLVFQNLQDQFLPAKPPLTRVNFTCGVRVPLRLHDKSALTLSYKGLPLSSTASQRTFLHPHVLLTRGELLDLVCDLLSCPRSRQSYDMFDKADWEFGQKFIRQDGRVFWATENEYLQSGICPLRRRRDVFLIKGHETTAGGTTNALCCEAICFLVIHNIRDLAVVLPKHASVIDNTMTVVLGRWFTPHPTCLSRDSGGMPICSGPLHINHCLWTYSRTPTPRRSLCLRDGGPTDIFTSQKHLFGNTPAEQDAQWELQTHAYYCLLHPSSIVSTVNMCPQFITGTSDPDYTSWLHTVTMI